MVPVLSTQSTSTLARVSILLMFCTRTSCFARRMAETTSATLASIYNPSGIIPSTAATMLVTLAWNVLCITKYCWTNRIVPIGMIRIPMIMTSLSRERTISERPSFLPCFVASTVSLFMYESLPTAVSLAWHSPDMMKLPERSLSPRPLFISSDSPVTRASFT